MILIYVKKYGGSINKNQNDLMKISYDIVDDYLNFNKEEHTKYLIVISAFKGKTRSLQTKFEKSLIKKDDENEAAFLATGELQTAPLLAMMINNHGLKAKALNAYQIELLTSDDYLDSEIISINKDKIERYLEDFDILVIAGYQGITKTGELTTLGLNGSDLTALYLASLYQVPCEIYKDSALKVIDEPSSHIIPKLNYDQTAFLIRNGLNFLQTKLIEYAKKTNTSIILRAFEHNEKTIISDDTLISSYPLNIMETISYQAKIYSPYINKLSFKKLVKKIFAIDDYYEEGNCLKFSINKGLLPLVEKKSLLIINSFKNTTIIVNNYQEYQVIYPDLHILRIPKTDFLPINHLLELKEC